MGLFANIGRLFVNRLHTAGETLVFLGETLVEGVGAFFHPRRFRFGDAALVFQRAAYDGLPVSTGIGLLLGVILAFQCAAAMQTFGAETYVADLLSFALFRELGPLVTAIILAGRSGSAFAAEIGTMKVDEELDALSTMGLPPVRFLVLPRLVAATLAMPILTIFAELAGIIGGAVVLRLMGIPPEVYWDHVISATNATMIVFGLAKGAFFGFLVGLVGCRAGMGTRATADGVGVSATAAVVNGIIAIAVSDGLLAVLCYVWGV